MKNDASLPTIEEEFESLITGLLDKGYGVLDNFLEEDTIRGLRANLYLRHEAGAMHPAGIGRQLNLQQNTSIRGDVIKWLETDTLDTFEKQFMDKVVAFSDYLNQTCYSGLRSSEFHYAYYEQHNFYKRHLDQFKTDLGRKYSLVLYLNDNWLNEDGGFLELFTNSGSIQIFPKGGRVVFFQSDKTEHEVHPSLTRNRISLTGWLKDQ